MVPARSTRSSSRRSSILKPPKPRHPLQNLNFNSSSNESSPATTTKIKRRVSFAEKKHVKEFCNSLEQGTLWDNTYEEHDLSNLKLSCNSKEEELEAQNVCKENIFVNVQENDLQITCEELPDINSHVEDPIVNIPNAINALDHYDEMIQEDEDFSPVRLSSQSNRPSKSIIVYEDDDSKPPKKIARFAESDINNVNMTCVQDTSMDFTSVVCNDICANKNFEQMLGNASMECTQAVLSSVNMKMEDEVSKKLTVALPLVTKPDNINTAETSIQYTDDRTSKQNISMEMTAVVPNVMCNLRRDINSSSCFSNHNDRTNIFHDVSMEITRPIKTNIHHSFEGEVMEEKFDGDAPRNKSSVAIQSDRTELLHASMEMTGAVPNNVHSAIKYREDAIHWANKENRIHHVEEDDLDVYKSSENFDRTRICRDDGMEFTTAVAAVLAVNKNTLEEQNPIPIEERNPPSNLTSDKYGNNNGNGTIFHNNSMTMTRIISPAIANTNNPQLGKTMVFPDTSMEITEAVIAGESHLKTADLDVDSNKPRHSVVMSENDNLPKDSSVPSSKDTPALGQEHCTLNSPERIVEDIQESGPLEAQSPLPVASSMALHETMHQDAQASASLQNNTNSACTATNTGESGLQKSGCLQSSVAYTRRTYTIQPLMNNDASLVAIDSKENMNISETEHDVIDMRFLGKDFEELESIKPPSFVCLDDLSQAEISMNTSDQKVVIETNLQKESIVCMEHKDSLQFRSDSGGTDLTRVVQDKLEAFEEHTCKSQTFVIKRVSVENGSGNSPRNEEPGIGLNEIENLQFLEAPDTETRILEPTTGNESMECSRTNIESVSATEAVISGNKSIDKDTMEVNAEDNSRKELEASMESHSSHREEEELDQFTLLMNELKIYSESDEIIWKIYHENIERNMFAIGFISCSLLLVIYLQDPCETTGSQYLKEIQMISRLAGDADALTSMVHRLILEKLDTKKLLDLYRSREDILQMLDHVSREVMLAMDFMFDLKRLHNINLMEISRESISFVARTEKRDIVLKITIDIKPFDKIDAQDISVNCLLGSVRDEDIKKLIKNIKRDHKFLRRYINDVKDYIYLVETDMIEKAY